MAPLEFGQILFRDVPATDDAEGGGECLDAVELARLAVVDGVGGDEVGQEARVGGLHPVERRVVEACPTETEFMQVFIYSCTLLGDPSCVRFCQQEFGEFLSTKPHA